MGAHNDPTTRLQVAAAVMFYMAAALIMIFANKAVLNGTPDLPLTFLFIQLSIAVVLLHAAASISSRVEIPRLTVDTAKKLMPVILVNVIGLVFNTLCLRGVEASYFQIARGLVLPLTIAVSSFQARLLPSSRVLFAALFVTVGFLLGVAPSATTPSTISLIYGVASSLFIALHAVLIKSSLPYCGNSSIQLAYWQNLGSAALALPALIFVGEPADLLRLFENDDPTVFVTGSIITGIFGFLLCVAGLLSIKVTSPVTHMFSSAARSVLQTLLAVWLFGDTLTTNRAGSIGVILVGTMYYTWVKSVEPAMPRSPLKERDLEALRPLDDKKLTEEVILDTSAQEKSRHP